MSGFEDKLKCDDKTPPTPLPMFGYDVPRSSLNRLDSDSFFAILDLPKCLRKHNLNLRSDHPISLELLELNVKGIEIPAMVVASQKDDFLYGSRGQSSKKLTEYADTTIKFKLDGDMVNYHTLNKWLTMLVSEDGSTTNYTKNDYATTFSVLILDQYEKPLGSFMWHGVFPVSVGSLSLESGNSPTQLEVDFTFSFDYITFDLLDQDTK